MKFLSTSLPRLDQEQTLFTYNALDCGVTTEVFEATYKQLEEHEAHIYKFEQALMAPVLEMMLRGIAVDPVAKAKAIEELERERGLLGAILKSYGEAILGEPLKAKSPKQLKHLFYEVLGLPPIKIYDKQTKEEKITTNRDALEKLAEDIRCNALVKAILAARDISGKIAVLRSGVDADGRMRFSINIGATNTGRFSSSKNAFKGGMNGQNITQKIRRIFIASQGFKLGEIDLKQADSVGVAFLSGDPSYGAAIRSGDLHTSVSRLIWPKLPWTGNIKQDRQIADRPFYREHSYRDFAKNGGHGTNYLGTPRTMAKHLKVEVRVMEEFQPLYFAAFPGIRAWHAKTIKEVQTKGFLITPFGRKRRFLGRSWDNSTLREAIAYVPQSLTADYINLGLLRIWMFQGADIRLLLQVHDSLLFEYPENKPELIEEAMQLISKPLECGFKCESEASVGWNWMKVEKSEGKIVGNEWGLASFPDLRNNVAQAEELDRRIS